MEMEQPRVGGRKVVTFEETIIGRRRNGSLSAYHHDIGRDLDAGRAARPLQPQGAVSRRRTYADGELDVFAAERYFKGAMDGVHHSKEVDGAVLEMTSARPAAVAVAKKPAGSRASAASSATSANSQTVLLRGRRGHRDRKCCVQVGALMRSCSGKRSVRVDGGAAREENEGPGAGEPAASMVDWYRELRMQKAALGVVAGDGGNRGGVVAAAGLPPNLGLSTAKVAAVGREVILEEKAAAFTSSSSRRRSFTLVAPVIKANEHDGDDDDGGAGSESSSDLFEIKSLMIDDCPYEPSEASIQWSVATASAADASSERVSARWIGGGGRGQVAAGRQHRDRPAGLLSGCVSHRAVDVSAAPTNAPRRRGEGFQKARNRA